MIVLEKTIGQIINSDKCQVIQDNSFDTNMILFNNKYNQIAYNETDLKIKLISKIIGKIKSITQNELNNQFITLQSNNKLELQYRIDRIQQDETIIASHFNQNEELELESLSNFLIVISKSKQLIFQINSNSLELIQKNNLNNIDKIKFDAFNGKLIYQFIQDSKIIQNFQDKNLMIYEFENNISKIKDFIINSFNYLIFIENNQLVIISIDIENQTFEILLNQDLSNILQPSIVKQSILEYQIIVTYEDKICILKQNSKDLLDLNQDITRPDFETYFKIEPIIIISTIKLLSMIDSSLPDQNLPAELLNFFSCNESNDKIHLSCRQGNFLCTLRVEDFNKLNLVRKRIGFPKSTPISSSEYIQVDEILQKASTQLQSRSAFREETSSSFSYNPSIVNKINSLQIKSDRLFNPGDIMSVQVNLNRRWDWTNMVTIHNNMRQCLFWLYTDKILSSTQPNNDIIMQYENLNARATQIKITYCGNFVIVGQSNFLVIKYNMQSGRSQGSFNLFDKLVEKTGNDKSLTNTNIVKIQVDKLLKIIQVYLSNSTIQQYSFSKMKFISKREFTDTDIVLCEVSEKYFVSFHTNNCIQILDVRAGKVIRYFNIAKSLNMHQCKVMKITINDQLHSINILLQNSSIVEQTLKSEQFTIFQMNKLYQNDMRDYKSIESIQDISIWNENVLITLKNKNYSIIARIITNNTQITTQLDENNINVDENIVDNLLRKSNKEDDMVQMNLNKNRMNKFLNFDRYIDKGSIQNQEFKKQIPFFLEFQGDDNKINEENEEADGKAVNKSSNTLKLDFDEVNDFFNFIKLSPNNMIYLINNSSTDQMNDQINQIEENLKLRFDVSINFIHQLIKYKIVENQKSKEDGDQLNEDMKNKILKIQEDLKSIKAKIKSLNGTFKTYGDLI